MKKTNAFARAICRILLPIMLIFLTLACGITSDEFGQIVESASTIVASTDEALPDNPTRVSDFTPTLRPTARPSLTPTVEIEARHLVDLLDEELITLAVSGVGISSVLVNLQSNADETLRVLIPAGTYFVAAASSSQNMVVRHSVTQLIEARQQVSFQVDAACANIHLDEPGESDVFSVQRASSQEELTSLMQVLDSAWNLYDVEQAAVWIVTDNANYDDLGILVSGYGFGSRTIDANDAARAMMLVELAGIDILSRAIWSDREIIAANVSEPDLIAWLGEKGVAIEIISTPSPGEGEISQYASGATASSQYSSSWAPSKAIGAPDTASCGDLTTAWASQNSSGVDWLDVTFTQAVIPSHIVIYQNYNPTAVVRVEVVDTAGISHIVYEGARRRENKCPYMMDIIVEGIDVTIKEVRIHIDQSGYWGWNEIDAVQLIGRP